MFFVCMAMQQQTNAQINVSINTASQPAWGPVGYDHVEYYYLPDADAYYYVPKQQYIYRESNQWVFARSLPTRLHWYDPYNGYKVVINDPRPYLRHDVYKVKYKKYKGWQTRQVVIRDSHDSRYKNNGPGNSNHRDNGNGKNKGKGKGHGNGKHN